MIRNDGMEKDVLVMLNKCVLLRDIIEVDKENKTITYKYKEYNQGNGITMQGKVNVTIDDIDNMKLLLEKLGFKELVKINDHILILQMIMMKLQFNM